MNLIVALMINQRPKQQVCHCLQQRFFSEVLVNSWTGELVVLFIKAWDYNRPFLFATRLSKGNWKTVLTLLFTDYKI